VRDSLRRRIRGARGAPRVPPDTETARGSQAGPLNIGEASKASGVSAKMIRHYEDIGLIGKPARTFSGYRTYSPNDIHVLRFVRQARDLGFPIPTIGELLALWKDRRRPSSKVKALALAHLKDLEARIGEMQTMKATLEQLAKHCHGDGRPDCPILQGLEAPPSSAPRTRAASRRRSVGPR
jgi:Cu(I)-responsive transcriptional regulator